MRYAFQTEAKKKDGKKYRMASDDTFDFVSCFQQTKTVDSI